MLRTIETEWLKLKNYKVFWALVIMYFAGLLIILSSGMFLMKFLKSKGAEFNGIDPTILPLYDFPDVWQNMIYIATFFKLILAFIVIISITNEITYRTMRQNVIDGLSKWEFLKSKLSLILLLSLSAVVFLFIEGLVMGLIYSHVISIREIFSEMEFFAGYFLELVTFLSFALLVGLVMKKSGFAIVFIFMYTLIFEPFVTLNLQYNQWIKEHTSWIVPYFPIRAINNLIHVPFQRYAFMEFQDYIAWIDILIVVIWLLVFQGIIYRLLTKRDI